ncbi:hypothetical protein K435DRAFT_793207 [Dendrothele bispora CBS 962.96]|uniref:Uncharacterized protein n=1 Tax=Dendrothele bispora (strain CBS 962.96) TaxID=1314807 RepID=A0A4S8MG40_DENBC|nr:hypothetical protein K435DRAFT_793207 [Dendrothele bispora CBS 962.96]
MAHHLFSASAPPSLNNLGLFYWTWCPKTLASLLVLQYLSPADTMYPVIVTLESDRSSTQVPSSSTASVTSHLVDHRFFCIFRQAIRRILALLGPIVDIERKRISSQASHDDSILLRMKASYRACFSRFFFYKDHPASIRLENAYKAGDTWFSRPLVPLLAVSKGFCLPLFVFIRQGPFSGLGSKITAGKGMSAGGDVGRKTRQDRTSRCDLRMRTAVSNGLRCRGPSQDRVFTTFRPTRWTDLIVPTLKNSARTPKWLHVGRALPRSFEVLFSNASSHVYKVILQRGGTLSGLQEKRGRVLSTIRTEGAHLTTTVQLTYGCGFTIQISVHFKSVHGEDTDIRGQATHSGRKCRSDYQWELRSANEKLWYAFFFRGLLSLKVDEEVAKEMNEMGLVLVMDRVGANGDVEAGIGDNRLQLAVVNGTGRVWAVRNVTTAVGERRFRYLRGAPIFCGVCGDFRQVCCIGLVFVVVVLLVSCYNNVISVYRRTVRLRPTHTRAAILSRFSSSLVSLIAECSLTRQSSQQIQFFRRLLSKRKYGVEDSIETEQANTQVEPAGESKLQESRSTELVSNVPEPVVVVSSNAGTDMDKEPVTVSFQSRSNSSSSTLKRVVGRSAVAAVSKATSRPSRVVKSTARGRPMSMAVAASTGEAPSSVEGRGRLLRGRTHAQVILESEEREDEVGRKRGKGNKRADHVLSELQKMKTEVMISQSSVRVGTAKPRTRSRKPGLTRLSIPPTRPSVEKEMTSPLSPITWAKEKPPTAVTHGIEGLMSKTRTRTRLEKDASETGAIARVTRATKGNGAVRGEGEVKEPGKEKSEGKRKGKRKEGRRKRKLCMRGKRLLPLRSPKLS